MGGRGETGKVNTVALGLGAGNWEGPASSPRMVPPFGRQVL